MSKSVLALALVALFAFAPLQARKPVDWTRSVAATPEGGFRMGNPAARVKLVEYGSLACPHCRRFEQTGYQPLVQRYVRTGRVSYEFRNFLLNAPDISVSLLAHCAGPAKFFPMSEVVYGTQPRWFDKLSALSAAQKAEIEKMSDAQRLIRLGDVAGFTQIAARFGVAPAKARQCLADPKGRERLLNITKVAEDSGINQTPTFLINGKVSNASTWEALEPQLKKAGGG
ncbi:MAG: thioredoxin domain-containing protein [Pseudomonadota bacterium]